MLSFLENFAYFPKFCLCVLPIMIFFDFVRHIVSSSTLQMEDGEFMQARITIVTELQLLSENHDTKTVYVRGSANDIFVGDLIKFGDEIYLVSDKIPLKARFEKMQEKKGI